MNNQNSKMHSLSGETNAPNFGIKRRGFLLSMSWTLPGLYLFGWSANRAEAGVHTDTHADSHTDGHLDMAGFHVDNGHIDSSPGPPQHNDTDHQDRGHADGTFAGGHYDIGHGDQAHADTNQWQDPHIDKAAITVDLPHADGPATSHADIHGDSHSDGPLA